MANNTSLHSPFRGSFIASPMPFITWSLIAAMSPVAVAGNSLVLAAIWTSPSLRTPCYLLLCGLAITDLLTGLITQPSLVIIRLKKRTFTEPSAFPIKIASALTGGIGLYLTCLTILILTLMSLERWLLMTRRSIASQNRFPKFLGSVIIISIPSPLAIGHVLVVLKGLPRQYLDFSVLVLFTICLATTSVAYYNVFRIIRCHQKKIKISKFPFVYNCQPTINLIRYRKSIVNIFYILVLFYLCYLPYILCITAILLVRWQGLSTAYHVSLMLLFASSSLNPYLCFWRMKDVRDGIKCALTKILYQSSHK